MINLALRPALDHSGNGQMAGHSSQFDDAEKSIQSAESNTASHCVVCPPANTKLPRRRFAGVLFLLLSVHCARCSLGFEARGYFSCKDARYSQRFLIRFLTATSL